MVDPWSVETYELVTEFAYAVMEWQFDMPPFWKIRQWIRWFRKMPEFGGKPGENK